MRTLHKIATTTLLLAIASPASAQFATPIRYNEGPGVQLTDGLVFHPGAAVETRYDSNPLMTNENQKGSPYLRLLAHLHLATLSAQRLEDAAEQAGPRAPKKVQFRLKGAFAYREYLSSLDNVSQQRGLDIDAGLNLKLSPSRLFTFEINDDYTRSVTPRNFTVIAGAPDAALPSDTLTRNTNRAAAKAHLMPGGGRLKLSLGYSFNLDAYEDDGFDQYNKLYHEIRFDGKYNLLPKTAVLLEVVQQFYDYFDAPGLATDNVNSLPLRLRVGAAGLITPRFSVLAKVGYGNGFYDSGPSFNSVLATVELGYQIGPTGRFRLGYDHDFDDSPFANYYADHAVYAAYDHLIINRIVLHLMAKWAYRSYDGFDGPNAAGYTGDELTQSLLTGSVALDYQIRDWVYVGVGYDVQVNNVLDGVTNTSGAYGLVDAARHQVFAKVGMSY